MQRTKVKDALRADGPMPAVLVRGWVRTRREGKGFSFFELNDGSCLANLQVVADEGLPGWDACAEAGTGAALEVRGALVESPGKGQRWEVKATGLTLVGHADPETFPLQKKRHSDEFLRTIAHLRPRTNKFGAMFRIRSELAQAVHVFFRERGFAYIHSPIITGSDAEGAGEMFRVTSLDAEALAKGSEAASEDFFGQEAFLTVSGQLSAEIFASSLGDVYTFGPTFRAENSNTPRHAAEFWMIEPEMAFADLTDDMDLAEDCLKFMVRWLGEHCAEDVELFARWVDKGLSARLENLESREFARMTYTEAVRVLEASGRAFEFPVSWGIDLQTEHERFLAEEHCGRPVAVYDYPRDIKAFYMRGNDDGKTVAAMDVLAPGVGEIVGGSQREERLDVLEARMAELGMETAPYWWYLDLRRFGSVPHAGFGMGFERLLMLLTGVANIRDVIPFPRTPRHLEF